MDEETILNRLKQNQAYNDHIVSQQAKIVSQFDRVDSLSGSVDSLAKQVNDHTKEVQELKNVHQIVVNDLSKGVDNLHHHFNESDKRIDQIEAQLQDLKQTYRSSIIEAFQTIKDVKSDLYEFKDRYLKELVDLEGKLYIHKTTVDQQLKDGLAENLKQIPETPPNIQDLRDTVNHKMRVFEIEVAKAVDKANHAEMLYKVVEKRTRQ